MDKKHDSKAREIVGETCENCVHFSEVKCDSPAFKEAKLCTRQNVFVRPENEACMGFKNKKTMIDD